VPAQDDRFRSCKLLDVCLRQGLKRIAPDSEKYTKPKGKERQAEAPLPFMVLLFFIIGTMSGKPVRRPRRNE